MCSLRRSFPVLTLFALILGLAPLARPCADERGVHKLKLYLTRPQDGPDADAQGTLRLMSQMAQGFHRLDLKLQHVDAAVPHTLYVEDGDGTDAMQPAGLLQTQGGDTLVLDLDSHHGDSLPLGAQDVLDFAGCRFEVRAGGEVVVSCTVPGGDRDLAPLADQVPVKWKLRLSAPEGSPEPAMKGVLRARSFARKPAQRFALKVRGADFVPQAFALLIETAAGSGSFALVGALEARLQGTRAGLRLSTRRGDALPLGVDALSELAGRRVQVRNAQSQVCLEGTLPALDD